MLFNSLDFALFFLLVWSVQRILPHRPRNLLLLAASCWFYASWDWRMLGLALVTIASDYTISRAIFGSEHQPTRRALLALSCTIDLSILAWFKYAGFFAESFAALLQRFGVEAAGLRLDIILPVGISFYTFQSMSYTIDVYRRQMVPLTNPLDYALFVLLFPQLVAGPIERGTHLAAQVSRKTLPTRADIHDGGWLILKGLFKKAVLADNLAPLVDRVFTASSPTGPEVLLAVYAFAFQIYGDFAGYTDIARGVGKWLGYDLMLNFRLPYFAVDPSDFWRRWHISLSSWLRDYLYIPLGGNRGGLTGTCRNLMLTMLLGGLWHGADWMFILWGLYHGMLLTAFRIWSERSSPDPEGGPPVGSGRWLLRVLLMFHLTCLGWLLFRCGSLPGDSLAAAGRLAGALLTDWTIPEGLMKDVWLVGLLGIPVIAAQYLAEHSGDLNVLTKLSLVPRSLMYAAIAACILALGSFGGREFIYFQF